MTGKLHLIIPLCYILHSWLINVIFYVNLIPHMHILPTFPLYSYAYFYQHRLIFVVALPVHMYQIIDHALSVVPHL